MNISGMNMRVLASAHADLVVIEQVQAARRAGGEGYAIEMARALMRAAAAEIAEAAGTEAAMEEAYRAGDALLGEGGE